MPIGEACALHPSLKSGHLSNFIYIDGAGKTFFFANFCQSFSVQEEHHKTIKAIKEMHPLRGFCNLIMPFKLGSYRGRGGMNQRKKHIMNWSTIKMKLIKQLS